MSATKRTFVPEDLYELVQVGDPQIHPDGDAVAFVRSHIAGEKKQLRSHIWLAPLQPDGAEAVHGNRPVNGGSNAKGDTVAQTARPYTRGPRRDGQPRWSPDGRRLAFVRQTGDGPEADRQIWIIERDGGEAWPLTAMRHGAAAYVWSPDSRRIAFVAAVGDDETDADACTPKSDADRRREKQRNRDEARLVTRFQYKFDHAGVFPARRAHVWVVDVPDVPPLPATEYTSEQMQARAEAAAASEPDIAGATGEAAITDEARRRTDGTAPFAATPTPVRVTQQPFDHSVLDWAPDGRSIAVGASYEDERKPVHDIWVFPVPGPNSTERPAQRDLESAESGATTHPSQPVKLTGSDGVFYDARWSPDGRTVAVVGHLREHRSATMNRLWLFPAPNHPGERIQLTAAWDRGLGGTVNSDFRPGMAGTGLTWAPDGGGVYFVADDRGRTQLYRMPVPDDISGNRNTGGRVTDSPSTNAKALSQAKPEVISGGPAEVYGFSLSRDGRRAAVAVADMFNPGDIYALDETPASKTKERATPAGDNAAQAAPNTGSDAGPEPERRRASGDGGWTRTRLTAVNADLLARVEMPTVEEIAFEASDGLPVHGWIMRPVPSRAPDAESDSANNDSTPPPARNKAPAVLHIHGGPHTAWGHSFSLEMHLHAAMGYAVIFVNPRGSTSYGQRFAKGVLDNYGGPDYEDLMAAVDYAVGLGGIDEERLAVTGGSYGGFMTNWIVTQTDRFRAGISHRSISNWISFWGVSDIGPRFMDGEFGAPDLWAGFEDMWERSPLKHARNVKTPLLICHSEHDLRCPMEQAEQFYLALKWEGKTAELLRHPRSNHDLTRTGPPTLRVDRFRHIARFLDEHVSS